MWAPFSGELDRVFDRVFSGLVWCLIGLDRGGWGGFGRSSGSGSGRSDL